MGINNPGYSLNILSDVNGAESVGHDEGTVKAALSRRGVMFDTVAEMVADTKIKLGQFVAVADYATGNNSGVLFFKAVAAGAGAADGGSYIDSIGVNEIQFEQNFPTKITVKMFGAVGDGVVDDTLKIQAALDYAESFLVSGYIAGSLIAVPAGVYMVSSTILIAEKCGLVGISSTASKIQLINGVNLGDSGIVENKNKSGTGQEWFFLDKLNLDGNKGSGAICGAIVKCNQIYVNSYINNCLIGNSPGYGIWLVSSPDGVSAGNGGPLEMKNNWVRASNKHGIYVDGDFSGVNIIGGAYENPGAGYNCIHVDGTNYLGDRANVMLLSPHFEFSNANVVGLYCKKAVVNVVNLTSVGIQDATQYNVYVDSNTVFSMMGYFGSTGIRGGIHFADEGINYSSDTYLGVVTNVQEKLLKKPGVAQQWYSSGQAGADITLDFGGNDVISVSGLVTTVANFGNASSDKIIIRTGNGNYTIRNNANIKLLSGADFAVPTGYALQFVKVGAVWYEIGSSA